MPNKIYSVKVGDKIYDIEGDRPPTQDDVNSLIGGIDASMTKEQKVESSIKSRGNLLDTMKESAKRIESPNFLNKGVGLLQAIGIPGQALEAGISNPIIEMQKGQANPIELSKQAVLGLTGQKLGQYGDVFRQAGAPEPVAATAGLVTSFAVPTQLILKANKNLSGFSKLSDKAMKQAGNDIIEATEKAKNFVGQAVDDAYKPFEGLKLKQTGNNPYLSPKDIQSDLDKIVESLPDSLSKYVKDTIGSELVDPTLATARKFKQLLGEFKPGAFGKDTKGTDILVSDARLNEAYGKVANLIQDAVKKNYGDDAAKALRVADEKFSRLTKSVSYLKKNIVDSTLQIPTKTGVLGQKIKVDTDFAPRQALSVLRKSGKESKQLIEDAYEAIKKFNRYQSLKGAIKHATNAAIFGGAIGAAGGATAGRAFDGSRD